MDIYKKYVIPIALFVSFLWGIQIILHKYILKKTNPYIIMIVGSIFYFVCMLIFTVYNWSHVEKDIYTLDIKTILLIGLASVMTAFLANLLYLFVLKDNDSYIVAALIYSSPVFTFLIAYLFLKEKVKFLGFVGFFLIVFGVICLALNERNTKEEFVNFR